MGLLTLFVRRVLLSLERLPKWSATSSISELPLVWAVSLSLPCDSKQTQFSAQQCQMDSVGHYTTIENKQATWGSGTGSVENRQARQKSPQPHRRCLTRQLQVLHPQEEAPEGQNRTLRAMICQIYAVSIQSYLEKPPTSFSKVFQQHLSRNAAGIHVSHVAHVQQHIGNHRNT